MKYLGLGLLFLIYSHLAAANSFNRAQMQSVSEELTVENYYNHICGPRTFAASHTEDDVDEVTGENLLAFISDPSHYTTNYRYELYDYYISLNGEEQIFKHAATLVLGATYEEIEVEENKDAIKAEVNAMLRGYVRDYIVPIQWNFCATAVSLKPFIAEYGCNGKAAMDIDFKAADKFCEDPYVY